MPLRAGSVSLPFLGHPYQLMMRVPFSYCSVLRRRLQKKKGKRVVLGYLVLVPHEASDLIVINGYCSQGDPWAGMISEHKAIHNKKHSLTTRITITIFITISIAI